MNLTGNNSKSFYRICLKIEMCKICLFTVEMPFAIRYLKEFI